VVEWSNKKRQAFYKDVFAVARVPDDLPPVMKTNNRKRWIAPWKHSATKSAIYHCI
jgi:hypothetical protein